MTALTLEEYGQRKLDLTRAFELAGGEVHSLAFKVSTGNATEEELAKAKAHRAALSEQLDDLESAWAGSKTAARSERDAELLANFEAFLGKSRKSLDARGKALDRVIAAMHKVCEAVEEYNKETNSIRLEASTFFTKTRHKTDSFLAAISPDSSMPIMAIAGVLAAAKLPVPVAGDAIVQHARDGTLSELEKRRSAAIFERCEALAPVVEATA